MKATPPKPLTLDDSNFKTRMNSYKMESTLKLAKNLLEDPHKIQRLKEFNCKLCYYSGGLAMQAFTEYTCALCSNIGMHHNSAVPLICDICAKQKKLCSDCGASIDGKEKKEL